MIAWGPITVEGRTPPAGEKFINVDSASSAATISARWRFRCCTGRRFHDIDTRDAPRVVIIDERMARQLWPGEDPIGKRIRTGGFDARPTRPWMTVVGVVGSVKQDALDADSRMAMYRSHAQTPSRAMNVVVRSAGDPAGLTAAVTASDSRARSRPAGLRVRTMEERVDESLARRRFSMLLLTLFAVLALGLAAIGIYGVMAYLVTQGTRELGHPHGARRHPARPAAARHRQGMSVALPGMALGVAGRVRADALHARLLFGVQASDPLTFAAIAAALTVVALVACYLPARRAARIDPIVSLRTEYGSLQSRVVGHSLQSQSSVRVVSQVTSLC